MKTRKKERRKGGIPRKEGKKEGRKEGRKERGTSKKEGRMERERWVPYQKKASIDPFFGSLKEGRKEGNKVLKEMKEGNEGKKN